MKILSFFLFAFVPLMMKAQKLKYGGNVQLGNSYLISIVHDVRPKSKLPVQSYRIDNSSFIFNLLVVTDRQLFRKATKEWVHNSLFSKINLDSIATQFIRAGMPSRLKGNFQKSQENTLIIRPAAWIYIDFDNNYQLSFEIYATFRNQAGSQIWKQLYGYTVPVSTPLFGNNSLVYNNGELLLKWAEQGISKCLESLFMDLKGSYSDVHGQPLPERLANRYREGSVLLMESNEEWIIRVPIPRKGATVGIVSKEPSLFLPHPVF